MSLRSKFVWALWSLAGGLVLPVCLPAASLFAATTAPVHPSPHVIEVGILVTATQKDAEDALKALRSGADFGVLAKEKSVDPTANEGGWMGKLDPAGLKPELRAALAGLKEGQYSEVVRSASGYAILAVLPAGSHVEDLHPELLTAMVAAGNAHYSLSVAGNAEEDSVFLAYPKPEGWDHDLAGICRIRKDSHAKAVQMMSQQLAEARPDETDSQSFLEMMNGYGALSQLHAFVGDMDEAIEAKKAAYKIAVERAPAAVPAMLEVLGTLYLHKSEMENGLYHDSGTEDIFPPIAGVVDTPVAKPEDSRTAIEYFTRYLKSKPDDIEVKWLLNLAYKTLGEYPAQVPADYLIPAAAFESKEDLGRFVDVAPAAGLNVFSEAGGVVVEDFDNDGLLDVVSSSMDVCEPMHFFHNNGDGTFTDRAVQAGLADQLGGLNLIDGDYNNDGCMDILVLRGGWEFPVRKSLLRNNCNGTFTDVTDASGLGAPTKSQTAAWADIDNDGYLDLFVGVENSPSQLFRNKGDGTFEDISHAAGIDKTAFSKGVTAADYDNDGYPDFYVSNANGANFLYHNNGNLTFTEIGKQARVQAPYLSFATWFFDYDNDGWPDIFVNCYFDSIDDSVHSAVGQPHYLETLKLYRNLHNGAFEDVTEKVGLDKVFMPMGSNFGDIDNDGFLDMYLGQGEPSFTAMLPHVLLRNDAGKRFVDITASSGTGEIHKGHGVAFADLERRGYEDIVAETGGAVPSDKHTMRVFENPGNTGAGGGNDWINIRLTGVKSNRSAVGAEIKVTVKDDGQAERTIYRRVGETSSFGGNPLEQHIGLGHGAQITALDIWWPTTNSRQHFAPVDKDQYIAITEFATTYSKLTRPPYRLGGAK